MVHVLLSGTGDLDPLHGSQPTPRTVRRPVIALYLETARVEERPDLVASYANPLR